MRLEHAGKQVIDNSERHQHRYHRHTYAQAHLMQFGIDGLAGDALNCVEQQVPTIEDGDGEQVDEAEVGREDRDEIKHRVEAFFRCLPGHLGHAYGALDIFSGAAFTHDDLADAFECGLAEYIGKFGRFPHGARWAHGLRSDLWTLDAQHRVREVIAERVFAGHHFRRHGDVHLRAVAQPAAHLPSDHP